MKSWAYRVYNKSKGFAHPRFSVAMHAISMETCVDNIIKVCKINVHKSEDRFGNVTAKFTKDNEEVAIVVYTSPEYH